MPTPPVASVSVQNCTDQTVIAAASKDGKTVYPGSTAVTIRAGDTQIITTWWQNSSLILGIATQNGPHFSGSVAPFNYNPYLRVYSVNSQGAVMFQESSKGAACSAQPLRPSPPTLVPVKPFWSPLSPSGPVPYSAWPQWAQALLWIGVLAAAGLAVLVVYLVRRSRLRQGLLPYRDPASSFYQGSGEVNPFFEAPTGGGL